MSVFWGCQEGCRKGDRLQKFCTYMLSYFCFSKIPKWRVGEIRKGWGIQWWIYFLITEYYFTSSKHNVLEGEKINILLGYIDLAVLSAQWQVTFVSLEQGGISTALIELANEIILCVLSTSWFLNFLINHYSSRHSFAYFPCPFLKPYFSFWLINSILAFPLEVKLLVWLLATLSRYFYNSSICAIPLPFLPLSSNFDLKVLIRFGVCSTSFIILSVFPSLRIL